MKRRRGKKRRKRRKEKERKRIRDSLNPGGDSRESYRYERCMLLPFLLCLSSPLMFMTSF